MIISNVNYVYISLPGYLNVPKKGIQKIPGKPIGDEKNPFTNRISLREKKYNFK